jgi:hypothetical protein
MGLRLRTPASAGSASLRQTVLAFGIYLLASVLLFARPVLAHLSSRCLCIPTTTDEGIVGWGLAWWPHALVHGLNPFYPRILYAPAGIDIAHGTLMPAAALVLWPLTAATSPLFAFNVAATLAPALAAVTAFHLCREVTGHFPAALVGGWLFGFSTYMLGQETGHLNLTLVFLVPVALDLALRTAGGRMSLRRCAALEAVVLVIQLLLALEVFATLVLFGAVTLGLVWGLAPSETRAGLRRITAALALALIAALVICSPYLYYALKPGGEPNLPARTTAESADLLGYVVPNQLTHIGGIHFLSTTEHFSAGYVEGGVYLGLPLLALIGWVLWRERRHWPLRLAAVMFLVALLCALGDKLQIRGHRLFPLPWDIAAHLPLLGVALPVRLVMYATLSGAVIAAVGLARMRGPSAWLAWLLAAASVLSLWPDTRYPFWHSDPEIPSLFTTSAFRAVLAPQTGNVLILPVGGSGESMLWQAESGLGFSMASGYVVPPEAPDPYSGSPLHDALEYGAAFPADEAPARQFIAAHHVTRVVLAVTYAQHSAWPRVLAGIGWRGRVIDGAVVFSPPRGGA